MNWLWEIVLACREAGINMEQIRFSQAREASPYLELSLEYLNQKEPGESRAVEINTYYRFYEIFKEMFQPDLSEYPELRASLTNLILHMLAENDVISGMTRTEYQKKMLAECVLANCFDGDIRNAFALFEGQQRQILLSGWLRCYCGGNSLTLFTDMVHQLITDSIVYRSNEAPDEILIYTSMRKTREAESRMFLLTEIFLDIHYQVDVFYEYHFGIIGVAETMIIGEIALCKI